MRQECDVSRTSVGTDRAWASTRISWTLKKIKQCLNETEPSKNGKVLVFSEFLCYWLDILVAALNDARIPLSILNAENRRSQSIDTRSVRLMVDGRHTVLGSVATLSCGVGFRQTSL